jgi:FkbM family methyltransferase
VSRFVNRLAGSVSRRLQRPELLAAVDATARQAQREELAIGAILASSLRGDSAYVDVGTNRGQVLREALRVAPSARCVAFEPIPALAAEVEGSFPQVDVRRLALSAHPGTAEFCHFRKLDGWSGLQRSPEISDQRGEPEYITVQVSTLDDEVRELAPSVVKIDVEGAEVDVLAGAKSLLSEVRPLVIFEHVAAAAALYGAALGAPWDVFAELDYEVFAVTGDGPITRAAFLASGEIVNWLARPRTAAAAPRGATSGATSS